MVLSDVAFASGLSSLMIVIIGWILGIYLLIRYKSNPDKNTLALAIVLISIGSVWLAVSVNFLLALSGLNFLDDLTYVLLIGWIPGVTGVTLGYMFVSIVKEEYLKPTMVIFSILLVIDIIMMYILVPFGIWEVSQVISFKNTPDGIPDASVEGIYKIFSYVSIIVMIITSLFFILTAKRTDIRRVKRRAGLLGIGLLISTISLIFDSVAPTEDLFILLTVRIVVVFGLIIMSMGITLPKMFFGDLE